MCSERVHPKPVPDKADVWEIPYGSMKWTIAVSLGKRHHIETMVEITDETKD